MVFPICHSASYTFHVDIGYVTSGTAKLGCMLGANELVSWSSKVLIQLIGHLGQMHTVLFLNRLMLLLYPAAGTSTCCTHFYMSAR